MIRKLCILTLLLPALSGCAVLIGPAPNPPDPNAYNRAARDLLDYLDRCEKDPHRQECRP